MDRHLLVVALAALAATGCTAKDTRPVAKADPPYVFPHSPHVDSDVNCKACHGSIVSETTLEARVRHVGLPKKNTEDCSGCHDQLPKLAIPARTREFDVRFNHAAHLAKPGMKCTTCHTATPEAKQVEPPRVSMNACTACHKHQRDFAEARCSPCHVDLKRYEKPVAAFKHTGDFLKLHGALARPSAETCAQCHEQTFCADCHAATTTPMRPSISFPEEVKRDFIHRGDFVSRHMIEQAANPASCRKCHGSQFCDACHTLQGVSPTAPDGTFRSPHPAGWNTVGSATHHSRTARRDITSCAGCHEQGRGLAVCLQCHSPKTSGAPTNPHPAGFLRKHDRDDQTKGICLTCHGP